MRISANIIKAAKISIAREYRHVLRSIVLETAGKGVTVATWTNGKTAFRHYFRDTTAKKAMRALVNTGHAALVSISGSWLIRRVRVDSGGSVQVAQLRNTDAHVSVAVETKGKYPDVDKGCATETQSSMLADGSVCFNTQVLIETLKTFAALWQSRLDRSRAGIRCRFLRQ